MGRAGVASSKAEDLAVGLTTGSVCLGRAEKSITWSAAGHVPHPAPPFEHSQGCMVPRTQSLILRHVDKSYHVSLSRPARWQGTAGRLERRRRAVAWDIGTFGVWLTERA